VNYVTLDFSGIKSLWTLHEYFKEIFQLPEYYGHNMDALWDCLLYYFETPTTIVLNIIWMLFGIVSYIILKRQQQLF